MWGLCGYVCVLTFHLNIWRAVVPVCSVNSAEWSNISHHELFSAHRAWYRLSTVYYRSTYPTSDLFSGNILLLFSCFDLSSLDRLITARNAWHGRGWHGCFGCQTLPEYPPKVHIFSITTSSVFAEMSQIWQVIIYNGSCRAEDNMLAQSPSITSVCVCIHLWHR